jgi:hypothetical protein
VKYHYKCPNCGIWRSVNWENRKEQRICRDCHKTYTPPTPKEQPDAYVDQHDWPKEMGDLVYKDKGKKCTVPGCSKIADTLDHRKPWEHYKKGTSYENLFPMCGEHNSSKGDKDYEKWLKE